MPKLSRYILTVLSIMITVLNVSSQGVLVSPSSGSPSASAGLDIDFNTKGILLPRVSLISTNDTTTIPMPAQSLLVYNTNPNIVGGSGIGFYFYCLSGCLTKGWKQIAFTDSLTQNSSEWRFYEKRNFENQSTSIDFTSLPIHDKWKLVFDIESRTPSSSLLLSMRLNNLTIFRYSTKYANQSPTASATYWIIYRSTPIAASFTGEVILTGKSFSNNNSKMFTSNISGNEVYNIYEAVSGVLIDDPTPVTIISLFTASTAISGSIELWYRDKK